MKKYIFIALVSFIFSTALVRAEFRVWSSKDGMSNIEAQFIQMSGSKVVLEKQDGSRIMVPKDKLCAKDQEYLAGIIPPKIKIDVDEDQSRVKLREYSYNTYYEDTATVEATIKKVNKEPCTQKFKAYIYLISRQYSGGGRQVIGSSDTSFSFEKKNTVLFSASGKVEYYNQYSSGKVGWEYEGYIVVVENEEGQVIQVDSSKSTYESKLDLIRKKKGGSTFSL